jgi:hypothetical protein
LRFEGGWVDRVDRVDGVGRDERGLNGENGEWRKEKGVGVSEIFDV